MRLLYLARGFLDYRIPVLSEIDKILNKKFYVIFSQEYIHDRVAKKIKALMGNRATGIIGERGLGLQEYSDYANKKLQFSYHSDILIKINNLRPDVILTNGFGQWTFFALLYKIFHRVKIVICYERTFHTERNAQWYRLIFRKLIARYIDAFSCNGSLSKRYTKSLGARENRITTGQMAADIHKISKNVKNINKASKTMRKSWNSKYIVFITVGRLIRPKGFQELLQAWHILEKRCPNKGTLILVGDGPERKELNRVVKKLDLKNVRFAGYVNYDDITEYYAAADVLVMPTLEDNWSLVVPEAMACGLPVLCSCYNGCYPELIEPGGNGWVFDPLDEMDTYNVLHRCLINRDRLAKMGGRSREIVSKYTPENAAKAILEACRLAFETN